MSVSLRLSIPRINRRCEYYHIIARQIHHTEEKETAREGKTMSQITSPNAEIEVPRYMDGRARRWPTIKMNIIVLIPSCLQIKDSVIDFWIVFRVPSGSLYYKTHFTDDMTSCSPSGDLR